MSFIVEASRHEHKRPTKKTRGWHPITQTSVTQLSWHGQKFLLNCQRSNEKIVFRLFFCPLHMLVILEMVYMEFLHVSNSICQEVYLDH